MKKLVVKYMIKPNCYKSMNTLLKIDKRLLQSRSLPGGICKFAYPFSAFVPGRQMNMPIYKIITERRLILCVNRSTRRRGDAA